VVNLGKECHFLQIGVFINEGFWGKKGVFGVKMGFGGQK